MNFSVYPAEVVATFDPAHYPWISHIFTAVAFASTLCTIAAIAVVLYLVDLKVITPLRAEIREIRTVSRRIQLELEALKSSNGRKQ